MKIQILTVDKKFRWPDLQKEILMKKGGVVMIFTPESHKDAEILNIFRRDFLNIMERTEEGRQRAGCDWRKILEVLSENGSGSETAQLNLHISNINKILPCCLKAAGEFLEILGKASSVFDDCVSIEKIHRRIRTTA